VEGLPPDGTYVVAHEPEVDWREYCRRYPLVYIAVETPTGFYIYGDAPPGKTPENCRAASAIDICQIPRRWPPLNCTNFRRAENLYSSATPRAERL